MLAENYHYYCNAYGGAQYNQQVLIITSTDNTIMFTCMLHVRYNDPNNIWVMTNSNAPQILVQIKDGELEPSKPEGFLKLAMASNTPIEINQNLYEVGLKL